MKKNRKTKEAIQFFIAAIICAVGAVLLYTNGWQILLFRVIPLNWIAVTVLVVFMLIAAIHSLVTAPQEDKKAVETFVAQNTAAQQQAAVSMPLVSPCTFNLARHKSSGGVTVKYQIFLNGYEVGMVQKKETLSFATNVTDNIITAIELTLGTTVNFPLTAVSGGTINLALKYSQNNTFTFEPI